MARRGGADWYSFCSPSFHSMRFRRFFIARVIFLLRIWPVVSACIGFNSTMVGRRLITRSRGGRSPLGGASSRVVALNRWYDRNSEFLKCLGTDVEAIVGCLLSGESGRSITARWPLPVKLGPIDIPSYNLCGLSKDYLIATKNEKSKVCESRILFYRLWNSYWIRTAMLYDIDRSVSERAAYWRPTLKYHGVGTHDSLRPFARGLCETRPGLRTARSRPQIREARWVTRAPVKPTDFSVTNRHRLL